MVRIDERVWTAWTEALDYNPGEPALTLLFSPESANRATAVGAVRESVMEVWDVLQEAIWASDDPDRGAGEWGWLGIPEGVLVQVVECDVFEEMMRGIVAALARRGVDGVIEAREWPRGVNVPPNAHMLIGRIRVRGQRRRLDLGYEWAPDADAHAALVGIAERWCKRLGAGATYALSKSPVGRVPVGFGDDAVECLLEGVVDNVNTRLTGVAGDRFREIGVGPAGGLGLVIGGATIEEGGWREALDELTGLLRENADLLVYGHVRRGWSGGLFDSPGDGYDWPRRPDAEPRGAGWTNQAFEDVFAPDAFGVQLLGPGYAGRVPDSPDYLRVRAGGGGTLVEHLDLPAWFDGPFIPYGQRPGSGDTPPPPVLIDAREELAPILYTPGALNRAGYADMPDL